jgi:hypothetical protein
MGALFIGTIVGGILLGITYIQAAYYFMREFGLSDINLVVHVCRILEGPLASEVTGTLHRNIRSTAVQDVPLTSRSLALY